MAVAEITLPKWSIAKEVTVVAMKAYSVVAVIMQLKKLINKDLTVHVSLRSSVVVVKAALKV